MPHDVFLSHANQDKAMADAVCHRLEEDGIRCWIAPRDIGPGKEWSGEIVQAIRESKVVVLVYSAATNDSSQVPRELGLAVEEKKAIIPVRIEDAEMSEALRYFLHSPHWLDAMTEPFEAHLTRLLRAVKSLLDLGVEPDSSAVDSEPSAQQPSSALPPDQWRKQRPRFLQRLLDKFQDRSKQTP